MRKVCSVFASNHSANGQHGWQAHAQTKNVVETEDVLSVPVLKVRKVRQPSRHTFTLTFGRLFAEVTGNYLELSSSRMATGKWFFVRTDVFKRIPSCVL